MSVSGTFDFASLIYRRSQPHTYKLYLKFIQKRFRGLSVKRQQTVTFEFIISISNDILPGFFFYLMLHGYSFWGYTID